MRVARDEENGVWLLWGATAAEKHTIETVTSTMKEGERLKYMGRKKLGEFSILSLVYGCIEDGSCFQRQCLPECSQRKKLAIVGTTTKDKHEVNGLRDICYYGGGLVYVGQKQMSGSKTAMMIAGKRCSVCGEYVSSWLACHWGVCDGCAAKCEHEFVEGAVIGGSVPYKGTYCKKCGRAHSAFIDLRTADVSGEGVQAAAS